MDYQEYLTSAHWYSIVRRKRQSVNNQCEVCGSPHNLQVHHLAYERLGNEDLEDLQVLCLYHHAQMHGIEQYGDKLLKRLRDICEGLLE